MMKCEMLSSSVQYILQRKVNDKMEQLEKQGCKIVNVQISASALNHDEYQACILYEK